MPDVDGKRLPISEEYAQELKTAPEPVEAFYNAVKNVEESGKVIKRDMEKRVANRLKMVFDFAKIEDEAAKTNNLTAIDKTVKSDDNGREIFFPEEYIEAGMRFGWTYEQIEQSAEERPERTLQILTHLYENQEKSKTEPKGN